MFLVCVALHSTGTWQGATSAFVTLSMSTKKQIDQDLWWCGCMCVRSSVKTPVSFHWYSDGKQVKNLGHDLSSIEHEEKHSLSLPRLHVQWKWLTGNSITLEMDRQLGLTESVENSEPLDLSSTYLLEAYQMFLWCPCQSLLYTWDVCTLQLMVVC